MPRKKKIKKESVLKEEKKIKKKRGRKPKGGKIVKKIVKNKKTNEVINIILHLKCSTKEIKNSKFHFPKNEIETIVFKNKKLNEMGYKEINKPEQIIIISKEIQIKEIWNKLRKLKYIYHNNMSFKKSACFWCTYSFTNNPIFLPKKCTNKYEVYGCFCSPECAVAYLKNESIDDSTRWERYALLNNMYSEVFKYKKNIKPAPNPYYTLDKFYGTLTIQEYRKLLSNDRIYFVVDKPLIKIMPELYEDNNEIPLIYNDMYNKKPIKSKYVLKRKNISEKKNFF